MDKRTRRFLYTCKNPNTDTINHLHEIDCSYHIYGYKENILHGFVIFKYTKTEKAASKIMKFGCMKTDKDAILCMNEIKHLSNIWEKGEPPQRVKTKKITYDDAIAALIKQNSELIHMAVSNNSHLQEQNIRLEMELKEKSIPMIISNNNNDNSKNKKITNISVFLNTECKDAITLKDFVSKLVITDDDLEYMKQMGYVESVTRLLKRSLGEYEVNERPIHCTDVKREVMHVKDQEGWKKETPMGESPNIDKAFRQLTHIHRKKMSDTYREVDHESNGFEEKAKIMYQIASAGGTEQDKYKKKIIKNITDEIRLTN
jgi:hypothetical protein